MININGFFRVLHEQNGSDLHLSAGSDPFLRKNGDLMRIKAPMVTSEDLLELLKSMVRPERVEEFLNTGDLDFAWEVPSLARYRVNYFRHNRGIGAVFREIPHVISSVEELGLPTLLRNLALLPKGLVLVTGPTGSGKSTTLAAILDHANAMRRDHIVTIEDPIEFIHESRNCLVNQREIGRDSRSFGSALRGALREDPDIILVGEMRDLETIALALEAAETGHLVFATLNTTSAPKTIDRIIDVFPSEQQAQIRTSLSESIQAVIAQTLLRRSDRSGRIPALEIMLGTTPVRNMIRESKTFQLPNVLQTSRNVGMQTLDDDLERLMLNNIISPELALLYASDKQRLQSLSSRPDRDRA